MAAIKLEPPGPFDIKQPEQWTRWKRRFEQYRIASGLDGEDQPRQVCVFLYCMGQDAEDVLTSTTITEANRKDYKKVIEELDKFFKVRRNVIFERAKFNRRDQLPEETTEEYITALYGMIDFCEYEERFKEEMLRDRLVVGIRDKALSEKLQLDSNLKLETAKTNIRQREAVKQQRSFLIQGSTKTNPISVDSIRHGRNKRGDSSSQRSGHKKPQPSQEEVACTRCGRKPTHNKQQCPARDAECHRCHKKGHYKSMCKTKTVSSVDTEDSQLDSAYLDTLTEDQSSAWSVSVMVGQQALTFKVDTGAEVTAISERAFQELGEEVLKKPTKRLYGPSKLPLEVIGQFTHTLQFKGRSSQQEIFVVKGLKKNLLGLPAIISLELVARMDTLTDPQSEIIAAYPKVFNGLGNLGEPYEISLMEDAVPFALSTPRRIPLALRGQIKTELDKMEAQGVISKVSGPTSWCAGMVVVPKKTGQIRICVDLKPLNQSVKRELYPLPRVDEALAQLTGATVFSKLDANSGFWQIPLAESSRALTTFLTPFGRYQFNKLPFGITSAPEHFQRRMLEVLSGLEGVVCLIDDVLVHAKNKEEHDSRLKAVLERLENRGVTLNTAKCSFCKPSVQFLGHTVSSQGISADPQKTAALRLMPAPTNTSELRRFLGMANQLGKFSPKLSELSQPLRALLSSKNTWVWGDHQETAFNLIKRELTMPTVLSLYDPSADTKIAADASSFGLGAVLLQKRQSEWRPVAYASRALTETECRYAQIEKEGLASTWACERFSDYILGMKITLETDHKPLVPIFGSKHLDSLPPRLLRFRLRMDRFDYEVVHVPGKELYTADALSRAPSTPAQDARVVEEVEEVQLFANAVTTALPASEDRLTAYRKAQQEDTVCSQLMEYCRSGWPGRHKLYPEARQYWEHRGNLTVVNDLLLHGCRIVVPKSMQKDTLGKLHEGHLGILKCRERAKCAVWWLRISRDRGDRSELSCVCRTSITLTGANDNQ